MCVYPFSHRRCFAFIQARKEGVWLHGFVRLRSLPPPASRLDINLHARPHFSGWTSWHKLMCRAAPFSYAPKTFRGTFVVKCRAPDSPPAYLRIHKGVREGGRPEGSTRTTLPTTLAVRLALHVPGWREGTKAPIISCETPQHNTNTRVTNGKPETGGQMRRRRMYKRTYGYLHADFKGG